MVSFIVFCFPQVCRALKCCPKWTRATACPDPQGALLAAPMLSTKLWRSAGSAMPSSDPLLLTCTVSLMTTSSTLSPTTRVLTIERRVCESLGQVCVHPVMQSKTCRWALFLFFFVCFGYAQDEACHSDLGEKALSVLNDCGSKCVCFLCFLLHMSIHFT